ncbi:MAG: type I restriction endonuclease subunit R [Oculatellaceae cyanobacterium Prado106]|jgi:hypothetical protein|nr:type I restriction endonuclease subunit R [Oculatellaceae cyanobacterium Prado106]
MPQTIAVTKAITNLNDAHAAFHLMPASEPDFFAEWQGEFPALSEPEMRLLDRLKARYRYYQTDGSITEGTVNLILLSPLLDLLGWCDPPYKVRGEKFVKIEIEDGDRILEGLIDALVVQQAFWVVVIESKRYGFSVMQALPQTLAYMMSNPDAASKMFGCITTGEDYLFVKLDRQSGLYDVSDKFTLSTRQGNELYTVVQVLKHLTRNLTVEETS